MESRGPDRPIADISVVVASVESAQSMKRCLETIADAMAGRHGELWVVDASLDRSADIAEEMLGSARVVRCTPGTLTPELWAFGIARSTGRIVVLTTGHFEVGPTWVDSLASAIREGSAGAAGRLDLANETSITDWAVFYLRYSEFLNEPEQVRRGVAGIPADNAAYNGDAIRQFVKTSNDGFWEVEFHRQLHAVGESLAIVPHATALYGRSFPFPTIARHRFLHGRHAGAWRVAQRERSALMLIAVSPLVPFALALRVWRRVRSAAMHRKRFILALPTFLALAVIWALGEAVGALLGAPVPHRQAPVAA